MKSLQILLATLSVMLGTHACIIVESYFTHPKAQVVSVVARDISYEGATLDLTLLVNNPYSADLVLLDYRYLLTVEGVILAEKEGTLNTLIPEGESQTLKVSLPFRHDRVRQVMTNLIGQNHFTFTLVGHLTSKAPLLGKHVLNFNRSGVAPIPQLPNALLAGITRKRDPDGKEHLVLKLLVRNPNNFSINVERFDYDLILEGKKVATGRILQPPKIGSNQSSIMELKIAIDTDKLGLAIFKAFRSDKLTYRLTGTLHSRSENGTFDTDLTVVGTWNPKNR